jgi:putative membrane protein
MYQENSNLSRKWIFAPALIAIGAIAVVAVASIYFYHSSPPAYFPWYGWFPFGWFFFIPVIFLVFFAFRWFLWGGWGWGHGWYYRQYSDPAMETLKQRFARGEITKEQFEQMAKDLEQH